MSNKHSMRAMSVRQPFAHALASRAPHSKWVENRTHERYRAACGEWVWLQASGAFYWSMADWKGGQSRGALEAHAFRRMMPLAPTNPRHYVRGAIIGALLIGETLSVREYLAVHGPDGWAHGPYCTRIRAAIRLEQSVRCGGNLSPLYQIRGADVVEALRLELSRAIDGRQGAHLTRDQSDLLRTMADIPW